MAQCRTAAIVLLAAIAAAAHADEPAAEFPPGTLRDPAWWPFAVDSPWNTPLGAGAVYEEPSAPNWQETLRFGILINTREFSHPVFLAGPADPLRWFHQGGRPVRQVRVPERARPNSDVDGAMHIVDERHERVTETLGARPRADGGFDTILTGSIDLRGPGVFPTYQGACAYGGSTIAGVIRTGELRHGIRHALRMSIRPEVLNPMAPDGKGHVWPANSHEDNYTGRGNIWLGSLLALPPGLDIARVAGPAGSPGWQLARALQDYGAYVVDRGHLNLYSEPAAAEEIAAIPDSVRNALAIHLRVVVNNGPQQVGGGGARRRPPAPPLLPEGAVAPPDAVQGILLPKRRATPQTTPAATPTPPIPPAPKPKPEALPAWEAKLRERVAAGSRPPPAFHYALLDQTVTVSALDAAGTLTLRGGGGVFTTRWADLTASDRHRLAAALAEAGDPEDLALAAFFALAAGDARQGEAYLKRLPEAAAAEVRSAFP